MRAVEGTSSWSLGSVPGGPFCRGVTGGRTRVDGAAEDVLSPVGF